MHESLDLHPNPASFHYIITVVIVRGHKVTVLILTFSECEHYLNTISLMEELQPEPETQPGATVGPPPLRRSKRKKVLPSFLKGALLVTCSASDLRLRPHSHNSISLVDIP